MSKNPRYMTQIWIPEQYEQRLRLPQMKKPIDATDTIEARLGNNFPEMIITASISNQNYVREYLRKGYFVGAEIMPGRKQVQGVKFTNGLPIVRITGRTIDSEPIFLVPLALKDKVRSTGRVYFDEMLEISSREQLECPEGDNDFIRRTFELYYKKVPHNEERDCALMLYRR